MYVSSSQQQLYSPVESLTNNKLAKIHTAIPSGNPYGFPTDASSSSPISAASRTSAGPESSSTTISISTRSSTEITIPAPTLPLSGLTPVATQPCVELPPISQSTKEVMEYSSIIQTKTSRGSHNPAPKLNGFFLQDRECDGLKRESEETDGSCWCAQWWMVTGAGTLMLGPMAMSGFYIF